MNNSPCDNIFLFLDGELKDNEQEEFREHLHQCFSCRQMMEKVAPFYGQWSMVQTALPEEKIAEGWKELQGLLSRSTEMVWEKMIGVAATILILLNLLLGYYLLMGDKTTNSVQTTEFVSQEDNPYQNGMDELLYTMAYNGENQ